MGCRFKVGDKVWLNNHGFQQLGGPMQDWDEAVAAVSVLTIKEVGIEVCDGLWDITVDGPLGKYMLSSDCFTPVSPRGNNFNGTMGVGKTFFVVPV